ncbi:unnamed protein product [Adineta steineri]|uniref:SET domain-containing protein n=1 Tax=Adineta steineri TaxID=433720 RepID=A0A818VYB7_9BILA|nr:unnamed protein product [Adineta steineri]CAF3717714.1 unnamed protein product [Adineta steineri]
MNLDDFLSWFNSTGVNTENINVSYSITSGFGLYSRRELIEKDFLILSLPEHLFIKPSFNTNDLTGFEHLIIHLLEEKTNPYIKFLRSIQCIPQWRYYPNDKYPQQLIDKMKKHLNKYNQSRNKILQYNDDEFQWAYYSINTRCVHFNMENDSKDQDDNLCLIPYLDFVNHSIEPNTISKFNSLTRSYEIYSIKTIDFNEQITFLYNPHSNVDLFIEYGFILSLNPYNQFNIEYNLEQFLSNEQIQIIKSYNYWNSLEFYSGDNDLSWTIIKAIELNINQSQWSPYDDPSSKDKYQLKNKMKEFLNLIQQNIEKDFQEWITDHFIVEKNILYKDFLTILHDTSIVIDKSIITTYIYFYQFITSQIK